MPTSVLQLLLGTERTYPNLFDAHPPFQIDGNFGGAAGILEMLVQSDRSEIRLLPALPTAWPAGTLKGVRASGIALDIEWAGGALVSATLHGTKAETRRLTYGAAVLDVSLMPSSRSRVEWDGQRLRLRDL